MKVKARERGCGKKQNESEEKKRAFRYLIGGYQHEGQDKDNGSHGQLIPLTTPCR